MTPNSYLSNRKAIERLKKEYREHNNLVIGFDFDDTVFSYQDNVDIEEVLELIRRCKKIGLTLCLWSTCVRPHEIKYKIELCKHLGIEADYVNESPLFKGSTKPYFNILLDDRAGLCSAYLILTTVLDELGL